MASIHIREKDPQSKTVNCIFHFTIPAAQNAIGMAWNQVIQKAKKPTPMMSDNDSTENANISSGSIYEVSETVRFSSSSLTNAQRLTEIQAVYNTRKTQVFTELAAELDFFGKEITI